MHAVVSVMSDSVRPSELQPARLLCPWDSPAKNTGVGGHALLQGFFLTQIEPASLTYTLHRQAGSLPLVPLGELLVHNMGGRLKKKKSFEDFLPSYSIK